MAKILKNDNESPEVDLKNLTVKLSGMGLDEEIEDMIPGKKKKGKKNADEEKAEEGETSEEKDTSEEKESSDEETSDEPETETEEETEEKEDEPSDSEETEEAEEGEDGEEKTDDEVEAFYEKRAAERDLTLEKVEAIASEMDSDDSSEKKVVKNIKKAAVKEKKKAKLDAFGICAIALAVLVLLGGAFYIYLSMKKEPDLGMTEKDFRVKYSQTPIFRSIMDFGFALSEPTYRKTDAAASESTSQSASESTAATETSAAETSATGYVATSEAESKYKYFDSYIHSYFFTVYVNGSESKDTGNLKMLRFIIPTEDEEGVRGTATATFAAFLQVFFPELNSDAAVQKITDAYNQSKASASPAVIIKEGDIAYSVSYNEIDGVPCIVMDVIPAKDASKYVFYTSYGV